MIRTCREKEQEDALITVRSVIGNRWTLRQRFTGKRAGDCTDRRDLPNGGGLEFGFGFDRFLVLHFFFFFPLLVCLVLFEEKDIRWCPARSSFVEPHRGRTRGRELVRSV